MSEKFVTILIMGVAGSGKTTIAKLLSKKINAFLIEADDYHSKKNIDKMSAGIPLNDDDRYDWPIIPVVVICLLYTSPSPRD